MNRAFEGPVCPLPLRHDEQIVIGHGSGGQMTQRLIENLFLPYFNCEPLCAGNDFAKVGLSNNSNLRGNIAISTDAHIVSPLFYLGGNIGHLAICGTVNDVAMSGAVPRYLTASFILEEGLPIEILSRIIQSMQESADEARVQIVAGDTKVAEKGKVDQIFITTTGIGWIPEGLRIGGAQASPGDVVILSGTLGDHGIAVLEARGNLGFKTNIKSDQAPLNHMIQDIIKAAPNTHVLRDPTRGGLATALNEIAKQSNVGILLDEEKIPVKPAVRAACEMLGFDPLYVANEGKVIVIVPKDEAGNALDVMHKNCYGLDAAKIGTITEKPENRVLLKTVIGGTRLLDTLSGELLPRIC
ncbi:MAG: hydrogenase expression/formation protein HypE [Anaerolineaceae bacterium]|nr:hydrogenase expression/formation protein HypE [Anaerolineaceae bacterium]